MLMAEVTLSLKKALRLNPGVTQFELLCSCLGFVRSAARLMGLSSAELVNLALETWRQHELAERAAKVAGTPPGA